jgi:hypothetical protein
MCENYGFRTSPEYYRTTHQSEWATDIQFRDARSLAHPYPKLVHHGLTTFLSPDVMRFLGRNIPATGNISPLLKAEAASDMKIRPEACPREGDAKAGGVPNPNAPADAKLLEAVSRGEFTINGFRNRDLRLLLFADAKASNFEQRRHAAAVSRLLALSRAHRLIRKVSGTHRYHLTDRGRTIVTALIYVRNIGTDKLMKLAA